MQRGQPSRWLCEAQLVRFSLIVMVKTPPSPFTCEKSVASESRSQRRVSGTDVHIAVIPLPSSVTPRIPSLPAPSKNSERRQRGSFM